MKSILLAAALTGVSLASTAFAYSPKDSPVNGAMPRVVPSSVVRPSGLPLSVAGETVMIEFSLDQVGMPRSIRIHTSDDLLKRQLLQAFSQWRFEPGANGTDAKKRYILPLQLNKEV